MIGFVVDSNSQLPTELAERFSIDVVPLTVTIDGVDYLEGVDLEPQAEHTSRGRRASILVSAGSALRFSSGRRWQSQQ